MANRLEFYGFYNSSDFIKTDRSKLKKKTLWPLARERTWKCV
jgi:hypothetical protein